MIFTRIFPTEPSSEIHPVRMLYLERILAEREGKATAEIEREIDRSWTERIEKPREWAR